MLGEAAAQVAGEVKARFPDVGWDQPARLRNRIVHGYWSIDLEILHTTASDLLRDSSPTCATYWPSSKATAGRDPHLAFSTACSRRGVPPAGRSRTSIAEMPARSEGFEPPTF